MKITIENITINFVNDTSILSVSDIETLSNTYGTDFGTVFNRVSDRLAVEFDSTYREARLYVKQSDASWSLIREEFCCEECASQTNEDTDIVEDEYCQYCNNEKGVWGSEEL